jgi:hypothetical protein
MSLFKTKVEDIKPTKCCATCSNSNFVCELGDRNPTYIEWPTSVKPSCYCADYKEKEGEK